MRKIDCKGFKWILPALVLSGCTAEDTPTPTDAPTQAPTGTPPSAPPSPEPSAPPSPEPSATPGPQATPSPTAVVTSPTPVPTPDNDGFDACPGDATPLEACDCNNADPSAHPGSSETCGDGIDQDCDGADLSCAISSSPLGESAQIWEGQSEGDHFGAGLYPLADLDGDGKAGLAIRTYTSQGDTRVYLLDDLATVTDMEQALAVLVDFPPSGFSSGDFNADGSSDVVVVQNGGGGYVHFGPLAGELSPDVAQVRLVGEGWGQPSSSVATAVDLDGDSSDELWLGDPYDQDGNVWLGSATLLHGPLAEGEVNIDQEGITIMGQTPNTLLAWSIAAPGDVDGDGVGDLLASLNGCSDGQVVGGVYLFKGDLTTSAGPDVAEAEILDDPICESSWGAVSGAGDLNQDGFADIMIGAPYSDRGGERTGAVYVFLGPLSGTLALSDADAILVGESEDDKLGLYLAPVGDFNGDGFDDIVVGVPEHDSHGLSSAGAAYVVLGPVSGLSRLSDAAFRFEGTAQRAEAGIAVAGVGDVNGDGKDDMAVGAPGMTPSGVVYLIHGREQ